MLHEDKHVYGVPVFSSHKLSQDVMVHLYQNSYVWLILWYTSHTLCIKPMIIFNCMFDDAINLWASCEKTNSTILT